MKNLLFIAAISIVCSSSCKKNEDENPAPSSPSDTSSQITGDTTTLVPASFTQKVLIEMFSSAAFGTCPDGLTKLEAACSSSSGKTIPVCIHDADGMTLTQTYTYTTNFHVASYPSGMVNRTQSLNNILLQPSQFLANASVASGKTARCGLAISSSLAGTTATVQVKSGFIDSLNGLFNLTVYLVEDEVTGNGALFDQKNNYNTVPGSPYYNLGNPITGFKHNHVLRKVISANALGDEIPSSFLRNQGLYQKDFTVNISGYNSARLTIVAFVNRAGSNSAACEILNVQTAKLGTHQGWD